MAVRPSLRRSERDNVNWSSLQEPTDSARQSVDPHRLYKASVSATDAAITFGAVSSNTSCNNRHTFGHVMLMDNADDNADDDADDNADDDADDDA